MNQSRRNHRKGTRRAAFATGLLLASCSGNGQKPIQLPAPGGPPPQERTEKERIEKQGQARSAIMDFQKAISPLIPAIHELARRVEEQVAIDALPVNRLADGLRVVGQMVESVNAGTLKFNPDGSWYFNEAVKLDGKIKLGACDATKMELLGKPVGDADQLTLNLVECGVPDKVTVAELTAQGPHATGSLHLENIKELGLTVMSGHTCSVQLDRGKASTVDCEPMELSLGSDKITLYQLSVKISSRGTTGDVHAHVTGPDLRNPESLDFKIDQEAQPDDHSDAADKTASNNGN